MPEPVIDPTRGFLFGLPEIDDRMVDLAWRTYGGSFEELPVNRGIVRLDHLTGDPRRPDDLVFSTTTLTVDTWRQTIYVSPVVFEEPAVLRHAVAECVYAFAYMLTAEGKRFAEPPEAYLEDRTIPAERIPDPWWRRPLVWLGFAAPRFTAPLPRVLLCVQGRAA